MSIWLILQLCISAYAGCGLPPPPTNNANVYQTTWPHASEDGTFISYCLFVNVLHYIYIKKLILDASLRAGIAQINIETDCKLDGLGLIPDRSKRCFFYGLQNDSEAHLDSCPVGARATFLGTKVARA
jgi:hypothetical protein